MNFPELHPDVGKRIKPEETVLRTSEQTLHAQPDSVQETGRAVPEPEETDVSHEQSFSKEHAEKLVQEIQQKLREKDVNVGFNVHEDLGTVQVELLDTQGKVVRKIPSDELVKLHQNITDGRLSGAVDRSF